MTRLKSAVRVRVSCEVRAVLKLHAVGEPTAARKGMERRRALERAVGSLVRSGFCGSERGV